MKQHILELAQHFSESNQPIISFHHIEPAAGSAIQQGTAAAAIDPDVENISTHILAKRTPSAFFGTSLADLLHDKEINELYITGFNAEFCCLFTSIAGYDRGFKVTLIEDAVATVNNGATYDMEDLDIGDFVHTVADWSGVIAVEKTADLHECLPK